MIDIQIADKEMREKLAYLENKAPDTFENQTKKYLIDGSAKIKNASIAIAKREARGKTGHYSQGFQISPIKRDNKGELYVKIYNMELYSMIIEEGGKWNRMPPMYVLDEWIQGIFHPETETELRSIAFAMGVAFKQNRHGGRGQRFENSKADEKGKVLTMTRAMIRSEPYLSKILDKYVQEGIDSL